MSIHRNFFGNFSRDSGDGTQIVDLQSFVNKILLFDEVILDSSSLKEIPSIIELLGVNGLLTLLESGVLKIYPQFRGPAETSNITNDVVGNTPLPANQYRVSYISSTVNNDYMSRRFHNIRTNEITKNQLKKVKLALIKAIDHRSIDREIESLDQQLQLDFSKNRGIQISASMALRKIFGIQAKNEDFKIALNQVGDNVFEANTNIGNAFNLSEEDVSTVVRNSMFGVAKLNQKIAEMRIHNALSGFLDEESAIFENRLDFLWREASPDKLDSAMVRVLKLRKIPQVLPENTGMVDVEKLLEIRSSSELSAFRCWLSDVDDKSDTEILEVLNSLQNKLGVAVQKKSVKWLRFLLTTGVGFIPGVGTPLSVGLGAADSFLLEEVLPSSGPLVFLDKHYPSLFSDNL